MAARDKPGKCEVMLALAVPFLMPPVHDLLYPLPQLRAHDVLVGTGASVAVRSHHVQVSKWRE